GQGRGAAVLREREVRTSKSDHAPAAAALIRRALAERAEVEVLGGAQHEGLVTKLDRTPLAPRVERHFRDYGLAPPGIAVRDRLEGAVAKRRAGAVAAELAL